VYLTVYLFTVDQQNNFTLMLNCFGSSHVLTPVSSVSSLEHFHYVSVLSCLDQIRNVLARLMSRYLCLGQCLSQKKMPRLHHWSNVDVL